MTLALSGAPAPIAHAASVCLDYPNQAAAQRAHDTRDADGDGIFCESLPCPCLKPSGHVPKLPATGTGRSVDLAKPTRHSDCRVRGKRPDPRCTPGARFARATKAKVCRPGYSAGVRNVSASTKAAVYTAYGMTRHFDGSDGEVDHLVSLELGGSNARTNLFPEAAPGSHEKDRLENKLHAEVCNGTLGLRRAQRLIATNWVAAYRARFG
ncbi:MAG: hypothetical protein QOG68_301 [Solirubrobacteraceae bacterium]|nr:hypothetical protein [Solirubrobacteraceae bacterium]